MSNNCKYELTIMIASLKAREDLLNKLLARLGSNPSVEILVEIDNGEMSIGNKRQLLLDKAQGKYVCYLDDDDMVVPNFCEKILSYTKHNPDAVGYWIQFYVNGKKKAVKKMTLGLMDSIPYEGCILQPLTHRSVVKSTIAKRFKFADVDLGEDKPFWRHIASSVQWEKVVLIGEVLYHQDMRPGNYDQHGNHIGR